MPHWNVELGCHGQGYSRVAGVDEVGRGCLAGPVVAAAVILNPDNIPDGIDDSKKLSATKRKLLQQRIQETALCFAVGWADVEEIDRINILQASKQAMVRAIEKLSPAPDFLLVDGNFKIPSPIAQQWVIGGDAVSLSIAAASIVAKVYRDEWMARLDLEYPGYLLAKHKGYGSVAHRRALQTLGPSPLHRRSFSWTPV